MLGFVLSVVLTAIPFWLVMSGALPSKQITALVIMAFAVVQIVVHMIYFLHMNAKSESGWTHDGADLHHRHGGDRAVRFAVGDEPPQQQHDADARDDGNEVSRCRDPARRTANARAARLRAPSSVAHGALAARLRCF